MNDLDYDDLPKEELKRLRKEAFRENRKLRLWNGFAAGFAAFTAILISKGYYPQSGDTVGRYVITGLLAAGLAVVFQQAVLEPRIRRAILRKKRQGQP